MTLDQDIQTLKRQISLDPDNLALREQLSNAKRRVGQNDQSELIDTWAKRLPDYTGVPFEVGLEDLKNIAAVNGNRAQVFEVLKSLLNNDDTTRRARALGVLRDLDFGHNELILELARVGASPSKMVWALTEISMAQPSANPGTLRNQTELLALLEATLVIEANNVNKLAFSISSSLGAAEILVPRLIEAAVSINDKAWALDRALEGLAEKVEIEDTENIAGALKTLLWIESNQVNIKALDIYKRLNLDKPALIAELSKIMLKVNDKVWCLKTIQDSLEASMYEEIRKQDQTVAALSSLLQIEGTGIDKLALGVLKEIGCHNVIMVDLAKIMANTKCSRRGGSSGRDRKFWALTEISHYREQSLIVWDKLLAQLDFNCTDHSSVARDRDCVNKVKCFVVETLGVIGCHEKSVELSKKLITMLPKVHPTIQAAIGTALPRLRGSRFQDREKIGIGLNQ